MLFPDVLLKSKRGASTAGRSCRLRIPTGVPRLAEASKLCQEQASAIAWKKLLEAISLAAIARLALLKGRAGKEFTSSCPWERFTGCSADCRCRGERKVTVDFLRAHYARLAIEIALFARPSTKIRAARPLQSQKGTLKQQRRNGSQRLKRKLLIQRKSA